MTTTDDGADTDVGSLGAETLRLLGALASRVDAESSGRTHPDRTHDQTADRTPSCTWCPVCQVVDALRETSPEALEHLGDSLESLAAAVRELTQHLTRHRPRRDDPRDDDQPVETIDLAEDGTWD